MSQILTGCVAKGYARGVWSAEDGKGDKGARYEVSIPFLSGLTDVVEERDGARRQHMGEVLQS